MPRVDAVWRIIALLYQVTIGAVITTIVLSVAFVVGAVALLADLLFGREPFANGTVATLTRLTLEWNIEQLQWALFGTGSGWTLWYPGQPVPARAR